MNNPSRRGALKTLGAGALSLAAAPLAKAARDPRPNIVLILADDMGYSDAGCFGGEIPTPNLDRLAAGGLRFSRFYNCARCCPTRASLLTGLYPHQAGMAVNGRSLSRTAPTLAETLSMAGYRTAMAGKWHLSRTEPLGDPEEHQAWLDHRHDPGVPFSPLDSYPVNRGFDEYYGNIWGVVNYFDPFSLTDGFRPVESVPHGYYITDAINRRAARYALELGSGADPFFLYVAHCAPHWPLHARAEDIARHENAYSDGWHVLRKRRYQRMLGSGLIDPTRYPLPALQDGGRTWRGLTEAERGLEAARMAVHAAMVDRMDQGLAWLFRALRETGQWDNTLILFLADNGASPEIPRRPGYDRASSTRDGRPVLYGGLGKPGEETTYTGIGPAWANACNTPFRYWKRESYEGGAHTPAIAHWPAGLKTGPGSVSDGICHALDVMPTCLELAGAEHPQTFRGNPTAPLEGRSLSPLLKGEALPERAPLFFEHEGGRAAIMDGWKLVAPSNDPGDWKLYHLETDRTETNNRIHREPSRAAAMLEAWNQWAERVGVPS